MSDTCPACAKPYTGIDGLRRVYACGAIYDDGKVTRGCEVATGTRVAAEKILEAIYDATAKDLRVDRRHLEWFRLRLRAPETITAVQKSIPAIREGRAGDL